MEFLPIHSLLQPRQKDLEAVDYDESEGGK
jgi:hypothetical protein